MQAEVARGNESLSGQGMKTSDANFGLGRRSRLEPLFFPFLKRGHIWKQPHTNKEMKN